MKKFNLKSNKGITLIALIITIIVLLILAGVTIAAINGNESAMDKAKQAKDETSISEAKEAAILKATEFIQDYMDKRYVQNDQTVTGKTIGQYVAAQFNNSGNGITSGDYKITASDMDLTVKEGETEIVTGTIDEDTGKITWNPTSGGQGNVDQGGPTVVGGIESLNRGDKVDYEPPKDTIIANVNLPEGTSVEGTKVAALNKAGATIISSGVKAEDIKDWVVLDKNETTGEVLIVPDTTSSNNFVKLGLDGMDGYNNAIAALNELAGQYKNPTYAKEARSITVEDINRIEGYDPTSSGNEETSYSWNQRYGMDANLNIVDYGEGKVAERTYTSTPTTTPYSYSLSNSSSYLSNGGDFWLASRCVDLYSDDCSFDVRFLSSGGIVNYTGLFHVDDHHPNPGGGRYYFCVLPVVSLKSNIQLEKIEIEQEIATSISTEVQKDYIWKMSEK